MVDNTVQDISNGKTEFTLNKKSNLLLFVFPAFIVLAIVVIVLLFLYNREKGKSSISPSISKDISVSAFSDVDDSDLNLSDKGEIFLTKEFEKTRLYTKGNLQNKIKDLHVILDKNEQNMFSIQRNGEKAASVGMDGDIRNGELNILLNIKKEYFKDSDDINLSMSFLVLKALRARDISINNTTSQAEMDNILKESILDFKSINGYYPLEVII